MMVSRINKRWGHRAWCLRDGGQNSLLQASVPTPGCKLLRLHFSLSQQVQGLWGGSRWLPVYLLSLQAVGEGLPVALRAHPMGAGVSFMRNPLGRRCMPGVPKPQRAL